MSKKTTLYATATAETLVHFVDQRDYAAIATLVNSIPPKETREVLVAVATIASLYRDAWEKGKGLK